MSVLKPARSLAAFERTRFSPMHLPSRRQAPCRHDQRLPVMRFSSLLRAQRAAANRWTRFLLVFSFLAGGPIASHLHTAAETSGVTAPPQGGASDAFVKATSKAEVITLFAQNGRPEVQPAKPRLPPSPAAASSKAAQERIKALIERRQAEEVRSKILDLKGQPRAFLIVKTAEGKAQLVRANAVTLEGNLIAAELTGGGKAVWQKEFVLERLDWPTPAEIDTGAIDAAELFERYLAAGSAYPELKSELDAEAASIKAAAELAEQRKAAVAAITSQQYDPDHPYTIKELESFVASAESVSGDQPEISAEITQIAAPFREHLAKLRAGQQRIDGLWRTAEEAQFENLVTELNQRQIAAPILRRTQLLKALVIPLIAVSVALLGGVMLVTNRRWRPLGVILLFCAMGPVAVLGWAVIGKTDPSAAARTVVKEGGMKVLRALLSGKRPGGAAPISLTAAELNAFAREYLRVEAPPADAGTRLLRRAFSVEIEADHLVLFEHAGICGLPSTILYKLKPAADGGISVESVHIGLVPAPEPLKTLLWKSTSGELAKVLGDGIHGLQPGKISGDAIEVRPRSGGQSLPGQQTPE